MDTEIKHAPGRTIQAVDALSRIPSQNKIMAEHPNHAELKRPLREELVLNAPLDFHPPSISDLLNETREHVRHSWQIARILSLGTMNCYITCFHHLGVGMKALFEPNCVYLLNIGDM